MSKTKTTVYHWLGAKRNLTCLADAEPLPIIFHWFHNGLKIDKMNATYKLYNESKASWLEVRLYWFCTTAISSPSQWRNGRA